MINGIDIDLYSVHVDFILLNWCFRSLSMIWHTLQMVIFFVTKKNRKYWMSNLDLRYM